MQIEVQPTLGSTVRVGYTSSDDCIIAVDTLRPIEALKLARELSVAAAQLTAFAAECLE